MRTQEEINYYFQSFAIKSAIELVKIESILEVHGIQLPNNIIIHKNGIAVAKFLNWWQNKSNYPETYEECCEVLVGRKPKPNEISFDKMELCLVDLDNTQSIDFQNPYLPQFNSLFRLHMCRDAYWKIAGEEMGLGKTWKPDWNDEIQKYCIRMDRNKIVNCSSSFNNRILAFPTEEMRDAFYENFEDLIKSCKELL